MADKLYPFAIDAPATVNKTKSYLLPLDKSQGPSFRINRLWIQVPDLDAIAAEDKIHVQLSTQNQNETTALLECINDEHIMTQVFDFHLAVAALTNLEDFNFGLVECPNMAGIFLDCSVKNYITHLIIGQDGAIDMNVVIEGGYTSKDKQGFNFNTF